jgi:hypothetical protein
VPPGENLHLLAAVAGLLLGACQSKPRATPPRPAPAPAPAPAFASPGPLARSHERLDTAAGCNDCHVDRTPAIAAAKCIDCHEHRDLGARMGAGRGFHSTALVRGKRCEACHLDHRGRSYDLMGWQSIAGGRDGFDHRLAGWPLEGKHAQAPCTACHATQNAQGLATFIGVDSLCGTCHRTNPHGFGARPQLACGRCHSADAWTPATAPLDPP